jgi:3-isopropylmalate/(R)-2-methylmalate dehydratase large subunit
MCGICGQLRFDNQAANLAVPDHNVPTTNRSSGVSGITDPVSKLQIQTLDKNCKTFGINEI